MAMDRSPITKVFPQLLLMWDILGMNFLHIQVEYWIYLRTKMSVFVLKCRATFLMCTNTILFEQHKSGKISEECHKSQPSSLYSRVHVVAERWFSDYSFYLFP
jgi:hypothetical protein